MSETPQQYTQRMIGNLAGQDPVKVQSATPAKLAKLIRGKSPAMLRKQPEPGKWSVVEILAHLADTEIVVGYRIRAILGAPGGPIQAFDQDAWAAAMNYGTKDARKSLESFRAVREVNVALLKEIRPEQWKHYGIHSERGQESVEHFARMIAGHDINHMKQIEAIVNAGKKGRKK